MPEISFHIILTGMPGAGKGEHARFIDGVFKELNLSISELGMGDIVRYNIKNNTVYGRMFKNATEHGKMAPNWVVDLLAAKNGLFKPGHKRPDGFPRTKPQVTFYDAVVNILNALPMRHKIHPIVVELDASHETVRARSADRREKAIAAGQQPRKDDNETVMNTRLNEFENKTAPAIKKMGQKYPHKLVNANIDIFASDDARMTRQKEIANFLIEQTVLAQKAYPTFYRFKLNMPKFAAVQRTRNDRLGVLLMKSKDKNRAA